ncbi:hypothetical protein LJC45_03955 [Alistipes sp. OttesenSCG-928-B03]|nr:hypothetical protein [Alistipes sp. OttesenSCG-928-B03]
MFEVVDYSEKGVVCRWCGNDVGVAEFVDADYNEKDILENVMANRKELEDASGLDAPSWENRLLVPAVGAIPVVILAYRLFVGASIPWYLWVLGAFGVICIFAVFSDSKRDTKVYNALKKLLAEKNYSFEDLAAEVSTLKAQAEELKAAEKDKDAEMTEKFAESLERLITYAYSKIKVQEGYTKGGRYGVKAEIAPDVAQTEQGVPVNATVSATGVNEERLLYIVPPTNCPGCNYAYKAQDLDKGSPLVCPHCALEIDLVDENVRTEAQAMVREFFTNVRNQKAGTLGSKIMVGFGASLIVISAIIILTMGVEKYYFSWRALLGFMGCIVLVFGIEGVMSHKKLVKNVQKGMNDLFEVEMFIKKSALPIDEFNKLKAEIVKRLKK